MKLKFVCTGIEGKLTNAGKERGRKYMKTYNFGCFFNYPRKKAKKRWDVYGSPYNA